MGTTAKNARDGEAPPRKARIAPFLIDTKPVTNQAFRDFVRETKYQT
jgi:formylglycine-generating enzyme required for sulfatase activity